MPPDTTTVWYAIQQALDRSSAHLWPIATALAAVGVAVMALLQAIKDVTRIHDRFDRWMVRSWLWKQAALAPKVQDSRREAQRAPFPGSAELARKAFDQLVALSTGGDPAALFALEAPRLVGQLSAASQIVADHPDQYPELFVCLGARATESDLREMLFYEPPKGELTPEQKQAETAFVDARNRIQHLVQRTLDGLMVGLEYRWAWANQGFVLALNVLLVSWLLWKPLLARYEGNWWSALMTALGLGAFSGFVAPVAKDAVSAIQQLRARPR